jgi:hypothetical protein
MQPDVKPLSHWQRKLVFGGLLLAFLVSLPVFIFYATGYRYDFSVKNPTFTATGGFYVVADTPDSEIYIDDEPVKNIRTFRSASYIQGIEPGIHRVHVQASGTHTWVKELPVEAHIVTEAEAFNLPLVPQVRLVAEYNTLDGRGVIFSHSSSSPVVTFIATSTTFVATSSATSTYRANQEHALLHELFAEQASSTALRLQLEAAQEAERFGFSTTSSNKRTATTSTEIAATTIIRDTLTLFEREGEVFVSAIAQSFRQIPHYFCAASVVESDLLTQVTGLGEASNTPVTIAPLPVTECREEIQIDRQGQEVLSFDFFPSNANLVLLHLTNGVYVVEIDDRSWQNAQPLYQGEDIELLLYRGSIFIKEGELIFEILPEIAAS